MALVSFRGRHLSGLAVTGCPVLYEVEGQVTAEKVAKRPYISLHMKALAVTCLKLLLFIFDV